ncbi:DUF418 domain-containing protein [Paenibacillus sp. 481]|uniref:DUF418 domain-containing protein n=1 Tax=Paenibacillus sp. 481 TaxID=2835869 RepID=UPI001E507CC8|nr:DUF418 domain-containing protein [Paenibacillus sp. 481]UHA71901.1 DUF418 domain-containing protein [Paenibacillus sp. 481]
MQRIALLDIIRGFAILGTLGTNIWIFASSKTFVTAEPVILESLTLMLVDGKFLGMLTILFGVGLEIKYRQALRNQLAWPWIYIWSSFILLLDGVLHYVLLVDFDILRGYAITAMIVSFLVSRSERVIKSAMCIALTYHIGSLVLLPRLFTRQDYDDSSSYYVYPDTWFGQMQSRLDAIFDPTAEWISVIPMSVFLFLCGVLLMRRGAFVSDANGRRIQKKLLMWGIGIGLPLNAIAYLHKYMSHTVLDLGGLDRYVFAPMLAFGYMGLIAWRWRHPRITWLSSRMMEVGKTALTCYILQNLLASVLFYSWGLGFATIIGGSSALIISSWLGICVILMLFAHLWLKKFKIGPFELTLKWWSELPQRRWSIYSQKEEVARRFVDK